MATEIEADILNEAGGNYQAINKLFPKGVQEDLDRLYSFVLLASRYVSARPQKSAEFLLLCRMWDLAKVDSKFSTKRLPADTVDERAIKNIMHIVQTYKIDQELVEAFLTAMQEDLDKKAYKALDESLVYVYGSTEVVVLMMCRILGMPDEAVPYARLQARAIKWISFLRDITQNNEAGRQYFPGDDLALYHLANLNQETALGSRELFADFVRIQLGHYRDWQVEANEGYKYIPDDIQQPIRTIAELYAWTARQIEKDPLKVYEKRIMPDKEQFQAAKKAAM